MARTLAFVLLALLPGTSQPGRVQAAKSLQQGADRAGPGAEQQDQQGGYPVIEPPWYPSYRFDLIRPPWFSAYERDVILVPQESRWLWPTDSRAR